MTFETNVRAPSAARHPRLWLVSLCALHGLLVFALVYVPAIWSETRAWVPSFASVGAVCIYWLWLGWLATRAWRIAGAPFAARLVFVVGSLGWLLASPSMLAVTLLRMGGRT